MPKSCSVPHCSSRYSNSNKEVTFHRFPFSKPDLLKEWIHQIGCAGFNPKRHTVICSTHFKPECFSKFGNRKNLQENAVPTVFTAEGKLQQSKGSRPKRQKKFVDDELQEEKDALINSTEATFWKRTDSETTEVTEKITVDWKGENGPEINRLRAELDKCNQSALNHQTYIHTINQVVAEDVPRSFFNRGNPHPVQVIDHSYAIKDSAILKKKLFFALDDNEKLRKRVKIKTLQLRQMNKNVQSLEKELRRLKGEENEDIISVIVN